MLYLPLEFGEITLDGLVDSGAFINAMSWSIYNAIKMNRENCIIKEYPQPPFTIECANAQLEQPIATADIKFNIGTYTFTDTFVILSKTSFPITGLNFMNKSPSGTRYRKRYHQLPARRNDVGHDRRNEKL